MHAAQLWIALPDAQRHGEPAFVHHAALPVVQTEGFRATVLAGHAFDQRSPVQLHSDLVGVDLTAARAARMRIDLEPGFEHALLCLRGAARVDAESIEPGTLLYAAPGRTQLELRCDAAAQLLLIGGTPFDEPLLMWWNFVARSADEIQRAAADWNAGRHFGEVPGTQLARVPAPDASGLKLKARPSAAR